MMPDDRNIIDVDPDWQADRHGIIARPFCGKPKRRGAEYSFSLLEDCIMEALFTAKSPLTAKEIAERLNKPAASVRPRLRNMERKGAIRDSRGRLRVGPRHREILWEAVT
jgi:DNA-binding MarR family transcriptional regulator